MNPEPELSWIGSVSIGGLRGGKFRKRDVEVAISALERKIKGASRQRAARIRIENEFERLARQPIESIETLLRLIGIVEHNDRERVSHVCFVDIELGASAEIRELGVAIEIGGQMYTGRGGPDSIGALDALLAGRLVVAHNGSQHDFPRLRSAGIRSSFDEVDSLHLARVVWPTAPSHSLGALAERFVTDFDPAAAHRADTDAAILGKLWVAIEHGLKSMSEWSKTKVVAAIALHCPSRLLTVFISTETGSDSPPADLWGADDGTAPAPSRLVAGGMHADNAPGAVEVVDDLRVALLDRPAAGIVSSRANLLDPDRLCEIDDPWAQAVGFRLVDVGRSLIELAPAPMRKQLFAASVGGDEVVLSKGGELLASRTTATQWHIRRPLIINGLRSLLSDVRTGITLDFNLPEESPDSTEIDSLPRPAREAVIESLQALALSSRFRQNAADGIGRLVRVEDGVEWFIPFPDPTTLTHGVTVLSAGPRGGERSNALWHALLGSEAEIVGPTQRDVDWVALDDVPRSRANPGHDVAALLGVAAARLPDGSALVVADRSARTAVLARAPGAFYSHTNTHLLRPPIWPTLDEARRRLGIGAVSLVGASTAMLLGAAKTRMLVAGSLGPNFRHPTISRAISTAGDRAYEEIVEPLQGHLAAEFVCGSPGMVTIADTNPTVASLSRLIGHPTRVSITSMSTNDALAAALQPPPLAREEIDPSALRLAERRLLPLEAELKDFQTALIREVASRQDALGLFRTGLGKSLCYQIPALALAQEGVVTVVVSPLLSLQRDQVGSMRSRGVHEVTLYNSELSPEIRAAIRRGVKAGFYRIVVLSPEALHSPTTIRWLADEDVGLLVVDEAHCISEMGHDFRPDYRTLPVAMRRMLGLGIDRELPPPGERMSVLALTGTASPAVRDDIIRALS